MKKAAVLMMVVIFLQGCSNSSPSQSEIKSAVLEKYAPNGSYESRACKGMSIENIQKVNGLKVDDSTYQISAKYDIKIVPVDGFSKTLDEVHAKITELDAEISQADDESRKVLAQHGWTMMPNDADMPDDLKGVLEKLRTLRAERVQSERTLEDTYKQLRSAWGESCANSAQAGFGFKVDAFATGDVKTLQREITMRKTDNGWMEID